MNETLTETLPTQLVQDLSPEILTGLQDTNNLFAQIPVALKFRTHYVSTATGVCGIEELIAKILTDANATFANGIEKTSFRSLAISQALFVSDIIASVREAFGADRYPDATIHQYLSVFMTSKKAKCKVGKIKLTNIEDKNRECCKPRTKFYLVQTSENI